jgi:hypothetical protein
MGERMVVYRVPAEMGMMKTNEILQKKTSQKYRL